MSFCFSLEVTWIRGSVRIHASAWWPYKRITSKLSSGSNAKSETHLVRLLLTCCPLLNKLFGSLLLDLLMRSAIQSSLQSFFEFQYLLLMKLKKKNITSIFIAWDFKLFAGSCRKVENISAEKTNTLLCIRTELKTLWLWEWHRWAWSIFYTQGHLPSWIGLLSLFFIFVV